MCFIHKWKEWSKPEFREINVSNMYSSYIYTRQSCTQDRTCKKCGKYQWREV